jgi:transcriptional regulator with XRE-family HTH domain
MREETLAERLARLQAAAKVTNEQARKALGVSRSAYDKLRAGTTKSIELVGGLRLARLLGVSPWELAGEPEPHDDLRAEVRRLRAKLERLRRTLEE